MNVETARVLRTDIQEYIRKVWIIAADSTNYVWLFFGKIFVYLHVCICKKCLFFDQVQLQMKKKRSVEFKCITHHLHSKISRAIVKKSVILLSPFQYGVVVFCFMQEDRNSRSNKIINHSPEKILSRDSPVTGVGLSRGRFNLGGEWGWNIQ